MAIEDQRQLQYEESKQQIASLAESVNEILRTIRGFNGTPGLAERVRILEENTKLVDELCSIMKGTAERPGLLERMRTFERMYDDFRKWSFLLMSTFVIGVVGILFDIIPKVIKLLGN